MSVNELYTLQCIINGQSRVTEKTPKDDRIIRDRIISYYSVFKSAIHCNVLQVQPYRKDT